MSPSPPVLGVVVPTLNEAERLPLLLSDLARLPVAHTTVVADGGSTDGTRDLARRRGVRVVEAPRGRGVQLNAGARAVGETPWLLFLHADVRLSRKAGDALTAWLRKGDPERAAFFRFGLEGDDWFWRFLEVGQRLRERIYGLAYGDQGLVVSREAFHGVGGYPEIPLMEDVEILRRLRRRVRVERLPATLRASPRRYEREGRWYGWLRNAVVVSLYLAGVGPERLAAWYGPRPHGSRRAPAGEAEPVARGGGGAEASGNASRILLVFAKAPTPGRVKTRLASELGPAAAARLYRRLGRRVVDQLRGGDYRAVVCYAPRDAGEAVREWLGAEGLEFRPQAEGDLGRRMAEAFDWALGRARRACVVGTDAPDVDRETIENAFGALEGTDVVVGPARDGGYYLLALDAPAPELFRRIPWSTDRVLELTRERAREAGLGLRLLDERADVDTPDDLNAELRATLRDPPSS